MKLSSSQFLDRYLAIQPRMQRLAVAILHDEDLAADIVQDCFVSIWNNRSSLQNIQNPDSWCLTLVRNRAIDYLRRQHKPLPPDSPQDEEDLYEERLLLARKLIQKLPSRQAKVVVMKHFEAKDTKQIASELNISEGNVYTLLSRAYSSLKQLVKDEQL